MTTIKTNNTPRPVLYWWELSDKERKEFDYIDESKGDVFNTFIRYKGQVYDLGEFVRIERKRTNPFTICPDDDSPLLNWQGAMSDSYFSGLVVKYVDDCESVIVGSYSS